MSNDTDSPSNKPGRLTLKSRSATPEKTDKADKAGKPAKPNSIKTGARAHQKKRALTERARTEPVTPAKPAFEGRRAPTTSGAGPQRDANQRGNKPRTNEASRPGSDRNARPARADVKRKPVFAPASSATNAPSTEERFHLFASCPRGLEQALCNELNKLGFVGVQAAQAGCRFEGHWSDVWRANLHSRLATRILMQLAHAKVANEDELRQLALGVPWERWLGPQKTLRVDTSAIRSPMQSLQYCNLLVKDSVCDRLRDKEGARPSIDTVRPDVRVHSFLGQDSATLYLDTSGESLFKRGWRLDKAQAPIRENLAAGLLALSGWQPNVALLDPFCGSGTILIEAAWIALNIPPGINRPFAFERLRVHEPHSWQEIRRAATESIGNELNAPIIGCDLSAQAIEAAKRNMQRAGLKPDTIEWRVDDARTTLPNSSAGMIVTNPPYGERLEVESDLMQAWATNLKQHFAGWQVNVISADHTLPGAMRLKPKRRVPLFNGALDCRLFMFEMVSAQYDPKNA